MGFPPSTLRTARNDRSLSRSAWLHSLHTEPINVKHCSIITRDEDGIPVRVQQMASVLGPSSHVLVIHSAGVKRLRFSNESHPPGAMQQIRKATGTHHYRPSRNSAFEVYTRLVLWRWCLGWPNPQRKAQATGKNVFYQAVAHLGLRRRVSAARGVGSPQLTASLCNNSVCSINDISWLVWEDGPMAGTSVALS